jgi:hypothetical protein
MRFVLVTAFAISVLPAAAISQGARTDALSFPAGARGEVLAPTADSKEQLITAGTRPDNPRYSLGPSPAARSLAWRQIATIDASVSRHTKVRRDAGIGFLVGLVGGAALGATTTGCCGREDRQLRAVAIVANGLIGGAIGGLVGAFVGTRQHTEDSVPATIPSTPPAAN